MTADALPAAPPNRFPMGVDEDWLFATERAQRAFDHHLLLAQGGPTPAGVALTTALVEGQRTTRGGGPSGWCARRRVLGHLPVFLGREELRDLGKPVVVPWWWSGSRPGGAGSSAAPTPGWTPGWTPSSRGWSGRGARSR